MASILTRLVSKQLRLLKPIVKKSTIQDARFVQNKFGEIGAKANKNKVDFEIVNLDNFNVLWVKPKKNLNTKRVIMYMHGGGYTAGHLEYAAGFGSILAVQTSFTILCVGYRLAPEFIFPAALDDAVCSYSFLLDQGYLPENISFVGESAGGGLEFATCLRLRELEITLPKNIVALSPWSDLAMTGDSYTTNDDIDPTLNQEALTFYAKLYAKDDLKNPLVSPLYGNLENFPETLIFAGSDEILRDDSTLLAEKLIKSGTLCTLHVVEDMWHVFPLFSFPESKKAQKEICEFLKEA